jgi:N-acetylglucosamine-6-sulfatase
VAASLLIVLVAIGIVTLLGRHNHHPGPGPPVPRPRGTKPNIVFVLTDDLSLDLLRFMPHVQAMEQAGMTFTDYFVTDSLCCPSRASIFTGNFPHNTGILENVGEHGGFRTFQRRHEDLRSFPLVLQHAGYATAMMGKYLNGYLQRRDLAPGFPLTYVPPGFSEWDVAGFGYREFNYALNENGTIHHYGSAPGDYLTDVIARKGIDFIDRSARTGSPFFLELATFAPHSPYTPAPRDAGTFPGLRAPRPPSFDAPPTDPPRWLASHGPLAPAQIAVIDHAFRMRVEAVQSVDRMIGAVERELAARGIARDTYLVFSSDNGLHTGEYRLMPGKMTAFDTDIRVPLVVVGPGVPPGASTAAMTENADLASTFAAIAGAKMRTDGHSALPLLSGSAPRNWRGAVLVEHRGPDHSGQDPDYQQPASGNPRTYRAIRTRVFLYVEYDDGEREFYDLRSDPYELRNVAGDLSPAQLAVLHRQLGRLGRCRRAACWRAGRIANPTIVAGNRIP